MSVAEETIIGRSPPATRLGDMPGRLAVAVPGAALVVAALAIGGELFAGALAVVAAVASFEGARLLRASRVDSAAVGAASGAVVVAAALGGLDALPGALAAAFGVLAVASILRMPATGRVVPVAAGSLCVLWIGGGLAHGVLLRELEHGGALVLAVLLGTFVGDTAAHIVGSLFGRRRLAPGISPLKTIEGLAAGIVVGTGSVVALALIAEPWLGAGEAAILGLAVSLGAPCGDLWESAVKREAGAKDSARLLGPHGGMLDRVDALLFTVPLGYYVSTGLL